jgi:hypothetical protein
VALAYSRAGSGPPLVPGCGHTPMTDDPELVAGVLLRGSSRPLRPAASEPTPTANETTRRPDVAPSP